MEFLKPVAQEINLHCGDRFTDFLRVKMKIKSGKHNSQKIKICEKDVKLIIDKTIHLYLYFQLLYCKIIIWLLAWFGTC